MCCEMGICVAKWEKKLYDDGNSLDYSKKCYDQINIVFMIEKDPKEPFWDKGDLHDLDDHQSST